MGGAERVGVRWGIPERSHPPPSPSQRFSPGPSLSALKGGEGKFRGPPPICYVYLAIIVVTWAGNWPLMKLALNDAPPLVFVLLRLVGTGLLVTPGLRGMRVALLAIPGAR